MTMPASAHSRDNAGWSRRLIGLFGAPVAWMAQINISEALSSYACYPHDAPLATPLWHWLPPALLAVSAAAFAAALYAARISRHAWLRSRGQGESRARFIARMSLISSGIFLIAILFAAFNVLAVSPC